MAETANTMLVELFLSNSRVNGLTHEVHDRRRLIDVLAGPSPAFRLESARVRLGSSQKLILPGGAEIESQVLLVGFRAG